MKKELEKIAKKHLGIEELESDRSLDLRMFSLSQIKKALESAYAAGADGFKFNISESTTPDGIL